MEKMNRKIEYVKAEAKTIYFTKDDIIVASEDDCGQTSYNEGWSFCKKQNLSECGSWTWKGGYAFYLFMCGLLYR